MVRKKGIPTTRSGRKHKAGGLLRRLIPVIVGFLVIISLSAFIMPGTETLYSSSSRQKYVDDEVVNEFIRAYNNISESPFTSIEKGNIRTKYFALSYGYYFELLNAADTDEILVTIHETNENAALGIKGMRDAFRDSVKSIDATLSDEEINSYFDQYALEKRVEDRPFGKVLITFNPGTGRWRGWIKIKPKNTETSPR